MKAFIVVATKGRPKETYTLLNFFSLQTQAIEKIIIVGSEAKDIEGLETHPLAIAGKALINLSYAGSCVQRNVGLDMLLPFVERLDSKEWFVAFFDDDFRLANDWIEMASNAYILNPKLLGMGGQVLADGISALGISEDDARKYISGEKPSENHRWSGDSVRKVLDLYGCNMAFRGTFAIEERFDEQLPFYGWQEDVDYSVRASKKGELAYIPNCKGVHMGVSGGRTSGVKFGYSQIANPLYLLNKGTMPAKKVFLLISKKHNF